MVRETRHLWVGNLPENINEERIKELFKRYGPVQNVKVLSGSDGGPVGMSTEGVCATVSFMDILSATKAQKADNRLEDRSLKTTYYEPGLTALSPPVLHHGRAAPEGVGGGAPINAHGYAATPPASSASNPARSPRFPSGMSEEHSGYERSSHFYEGRRGGGDDGLSYGGALVSGGNQLLRRTYLPGVDRGDPSEYVGPRNHHRMRHYNPRCPYNGGGQGDPAEYRWGGTGPAPYRQYSGVQDPYMELDKMVRRPPRPLPPMIVTPVSPPLTPRPSQPPHNSRMPSCASSARRRRQSGSGSRSSSRSSSSSSSTSSTSRSSSSSSRSVSPRRLSIANSVGGICSPTDDKRPLAICVRNLPPWSTDSSLKDGLFHDYKKHGKVTTVRVMGAGNERFAIVCFKKAEDAEKALVASQEKHFFGFKIQVAPHEGVELDESECRVFDVELDEFHPRATRTLFIGNLEKGITIEDLKKQFEAFGEIIEIDIKKQSMSTFAFCQYSDIRSVVRAMKTLDGEHMGPSRLKLGFGKSMPTRCVWMDGVPEGTIETQVHDQFARFGSVTQVIVDRTKGHALVFFENEKCAASAVLEMRGKILNGKKLQIDFASRECQAAFFDHLSKQGNTVVPVPEKTWEKREPTPIEKDPSTFNRTERARRGGTAAFSRGGTTMANRPTNFNAAPGRPRGRFEPYDERNYDEYSQGSAASYEDSYERELREYAGSQRFGDGALPVPSATVTPQTTIPRRASFSPTSRVGHDENSPSPRRRSLSREDQECHSPTVRSSYEGSEICSRRLSRRSASDRDSCHSPSPPESLPDTSPQPVVAGVRIKAGVTPKKAPSTMTLSPLTPPSASPSREVTVLEDRPLVDPRDHRRRSNDLKELVVRVNDKRSTGTVHHYPESTTHLAAVTQRQQQHLPLTPHIDDEQVVSSSCGLVCAPLDPRLVVNRQGLEDIGSSGDERLSEPDNRPSKKPRYTEVIPGSTGNDKQRHPSKKILADSSVTKAAFRRPLESRRGSVPMSSRRESGTGGGKNVDETPKDPRLRRLQSHGGEEETWWPSRDAVSSSSFEVEDISPPGTPVRDEREETVDYYGHVRHSVPKFRPPPMSLPLPKFAQSLRAHLSPRAPPTSPKGVGFLRSPPPIPTLVPRPDLREVGVGFVDTPASPGPREAIASNVVEESPALSPGSPVDLELRIKELEEKYEKWSGSTRTGPAPLTKANCVEGVPIDRKPKLLELHELRSQPSDIVKSLLLKRSVFDEDSKRLENVGDKYEPKAFSIANTSTVINKPVVLGVTNQNSGPCSPRVPLTPRTPVPPSATPASSLPGLRPSFSQWPPTPTPRMSTPSFTADTKAQVSPVLHRQTVAAVSNVSNIHGNSSGSLYSPITPTTPTLHMTGLTSIGKIRRRSSLAVVSPTVTEESIPALTDKETVRVPSPNTLEPVLEKIPESCSTPNVENVSVDKDSVSVGDDNLSACVSSEIPPSMEVCTQQEPMQSDLKAPLQKVSSNSSVTDYMKDADMCELKDKFCEKGTSRTELLQRAESVEVCVNSIQDSNIRIFGEKIVSCKQEITSLEHGAVDTTVVKMEEGHESVAASHIDPQAVADVERNDISELNLPVKVKEEGELKETTSLQMVTEEDPVPAVETSVLVPTNVVAIEASPLTPMAVPATLGVSVRLERVSRALVDLPPIKDVTKSEQLVHKRKHSGEDVEEDGRPKSISEAKRSRHEHGDEKSKDRRDRRASRDGKTGRKRDDEKRRKSEVFDSHVQNETELKTIGKGEENKKEERRDKVKEKSVCGDKLDKREESKSDKSVHDDIERKEKKEEKLRLEIDKRKSEEHKTKEKLDHKNREKDKARSDKVSRDEKEHRHGKERERGKDRDKDKSKHQRERDNKEKSKVKNMLALNTLDPDKEKMKVDHDSLKRKSTDHHERKHSDKIKDTKLNKLPNCNANHREKIKHRKPLAENTQEASKTMSVLANVKCIHPEENIWTPEPRLPETEEKKPESRTKESHRRKHDSGRSDRSGETDTQLKNAVSRCKQIGSHQVLKNSKETALSLLPSNDRASVSDSSNDEVKVKKTLQLAPSRRVSVSSKIKLTLHPSDKSTEHTTNVMPKKHVRRTQVDSDSDSNSSSSDSNSDGPPKHSIFDIPADDGMYDMYDKVKARRLKLQQKQDEERRQQELKQRTLEQFRLQQQRRKERKNAALLSPLPNISDSDSEITIKGKKSRIRPSTSSEEDLHNDRKHGSSDDSENDAQFQKLKKSDGCNKSMKDSKSEKHISAANMSDISSDEDVINKTTSRKLPEMRHSIYTDSEPEKMDSVAQTRPSHKVSQLFESGSGESSDEVAVTKPPKPSTRVKVRDKEWFHHRLEKAPLSRELVATSDESEEESIETLQKAISAAKLPKTDTETKAVKERRTEDVRDKGVSKKGVRMEAIFGECSEDEESDAPPKAVSDVKCKVSVIVTSPPIASLCPPVSKMSVETVYEDSDSEDNNRLSETIKAVLAKSEENVENYQTSTVKEIKGDIDLRKLDGWPNIKKHERTVTGTEKVCSDSGKGSSSSNTSNSSNCASSTSSLEEGNHADTSHLEEAHSEESGNTTLGTDKLEKGAVTVKESEHHRDRKKKKKHREKERSSSSSHHHRHYSTSSRISNAAVDKGRLDQSHAKVLQNAMPICTDQDLTSHNESNHLPNLGTFVPLSNEVSKSVTNVQSKQVPSLLDDSLALSGSIDKEKKKISNQISPNLNEVPQLPQDFKLRHENMSQLPLEIPEVVSLNLKTPVESNLFPEKPFSEVDINDATAKTNTFSGKGSRTIISQEETLNAVAGLLAYYDDDGYCEETGAPAGDTEDPLLSSDPPVALDEEAQKAAQILQCEMPGEREDQWSQPLAVQPAVSESINVSKVVRDETIEEPVVFYQVNDNSPPSVLSEPELQIDEDRVGELGYQEMADMHVANMSELQDISEQCKPEQSKIETNLRHNSEIEKCVDAEEKCIRDSVLPKDSVIIRNTKVANFQLAPVQISGECETKVDNIDHLKFSTPVIGVDVSMITNASSVILPIDNKVEVGLSKKLTNDVALQDNVNNSSETELMGTHGNVPRGIRGRRGCKSTDAAVVVANKELDITVGASRGTGKNRGRGGSSRSQNSESDSPSAASRNEPRRSSRTKRVRRHPDMVDTGETTGNRNRKTRGAGRGSAANDLRSAVDIPSFSDVYDFRESDDDAEDMGMATKAKGAKKEGSVRTPKSEIDELSVAETEDKITTTPITIRKSRRLQDKSGDDELPKDDMIEAPSVHPATPRNVTKGRGKPVKEMEAESVISPVCSVATTEAAVIVEKEKVSEVDISVVAVSTPSIILPGRERKSEAELVDPVTGVVSLVKVCEEGQYVRDSGETCVTSVGGPVEGSKIGNLPVECTKVIHASTSEITIQSAPEHSSLAGSRPSVTMTVVSAGACPVMPMMPVVAGRLGEVSVELVPRSVASTMTSVPVSSANPPSITVTATVRPGGSVVNSQMVFPVQQKVVLQTPTHPQQSTVLKSIVAVSTLTPSNASGRPALSTSMTDASFYKGIVPVAKSSSQQVLSVIPRTVVVPKPGHPAPSVPTGEANRPGPPMARPSPSLAGLPIMDNPPALPRGYLDERRGEYVVMPSQQQQRYAPLDPHFLEPPRVEVSHLIPNQGGSAAHSPGMAARVMEATDSCRGVLTPPQHPSLPSGFELHAKPTLGHNHSVGPMSGTVVAAPFYHQGGGGDMREYTHHRPPLQSPHAPGAGGSSMERFTSPPLSTPPAALTPPPAHQNAVIQGDMMRSTHQQYLQMYPPGYYVRDPRSLYGERTVSALPMDMKADRYDKEEKYESRPPGTPGPADYLPRTPAVALIPRGQLSPHFLPSPHHDRSTDSPQVAMIYHQYYDNPYYHGRGVPEHDPLSRHSSPSGGGHLYHHQGGSLPPPPPSSDNHHQPIVQISTPQYASQVPPQGDSLQVLLDEFQAVWAGLLGLKNDLACVQMYFVSGSIDVARGALQFHPDGTTSPIRIAQRMRLEQTQLEGVARKMQMEAEHCMLLALPHGQDSFDMLQQQMNLRNGFITYLGLKQAAGIVNVNAPISNMPGFVIHIFPPCDFANENLARIAPDLLHRVADISHLVVVIATQ